MSIHCSGRTGGRKGRRIAFALSTILCSGLAAPAIAQTEPAPFLNIDENGVDLTDGRFKFSLPHGSIGSGAAQLTLAKDFDGTRESDGMPGPLTRNGSSIVIDFGLTSQQFTLTSGTWVPSQGNGATLTVASGGSGADTFTYIAADGTTIIYTGNGLGVGTGLFCGNGATTDCFALPMTVTQPSGRKLTYTWRSGLGCSGSGPSNCSIHFRLSAVANESGYLIKFKYAEDTVTPGDKPPATWFARASAKFINLAVDFCDPTAFDCDITSQSWPTATYTSPSATVQEITNTGGGTWRITKDGGRVIGVQRPGETSDSTTVSYGTNGVSAVTRDGVTTQYARTAAFPNRYRMVRTDALANTITVESDITQYRPASVTDETGKTTTFLYDGSDRPIEITAPENNKVLFEYDARGNVKKKTLKAKPGSGLADIVTEAFYPATCTYQPSCNKPEWTEDALNNRTDYDWDDTTGNLLSVTLPAADANPGTVRPKTIYGYSSLQAYYKNSGGSIVASGQPVSLLTSTSSCVANATCAGTTDEVKTVVAYGTTGVANNLLPTGVTNAAGTLNALTTTSYDRIGNVTSVDGPLTDDIVTYRYDAARNRTGMIAPDPDGADPHKRRAQKVSYNGIGRPTQVEVGTVAGTSDSDWAAFVQAHRVEMVYANGRLDRQTLASGGTAYQVTGYHYDDVGRTDCVATRMWWSSLPETACDLGTTPSGYGPDRITKYAYDKASRVQQVQTGVGTDAQADDVTTTYTDNGQVKTVTDGKGNTTTYEYDGFDRLTKTRYPSTTAGSGTSSTTDYEGLVYNANSQVTLRQLRGFAADSTRHIDFTYDNLGRLVVKDLPSPEADVTYTYDLLGRMTAVADAAQTLGFSWDQLGRNTLASGPLGNVSYQYDLAGQRTRMTWPDGFYVEYKYDNAGQMTQIRENGASSGIGVLATFAYDDLGRRTSLTRGNGQVTTYTYDAVSRLDSLTNNLNGTADDVTGTYQYNPAQQIIQTVRSNDAYAFNDSTNGARNYTINGLNQATVAGNRTLTYDARGNLWKDQLTGTPTNGREYSYTTQNQLKGVKTTAASPANLAVLSYDPLMRLYGTGTTGVSRRMQYDGVSAIAEYDNAGARTWRYVHGPGMDEPLVQYTGGGTRRWLHADERGSVIAWSDDLGNRQAINAYDEYGVPESTNYSARYQYTGQMWLSEAGVYYYKARMYAPSLGRFLQADPIGFRAGMNLYGYVGGDPINLIDPTGTQTAPADPPADDSDWDVLITNRKIFATFLSLSDFSTLNNFYLMPLCGEAVSNDCELVITHDSRPPSEPCPSGSQLIVGRGVSGTAFTGLFGLSGGGGASVSIPTASLPFFGDGSFKGTQVTGSLSVTPLVGVGAFLGFGPSLSAGGSTSSTPRGVSGSVTPVIQLGAGDGAGVEVSTDFTDPLGASVAMGKIAGGIYGAVGARFQANLSTGPLGCE